MTKPRTLASTLVTLGPDLVIVPKGVWHTASPHRQTRMLFVTPGEGTENRAEPVRGKAH